MAPRRIPDVMRNRILGCTQGPRARPTHSAPRRILGALLCLLPLRALAGPDPFAGPADPAAAPYRVAASGFVTDSGHPKHPGDFTRVEIAVRLCVNPGLGESLIEVESGESADPSVDRYAVRRGRIFQVDEHGLEIPAASLGDLTAATVAALHPAIVVDAIQERRENLHATGKERALFAWSDELWTVSAAGGRIEKLERRITSDVLGDGVETVRFENWPRGDDAHPGRVTVTARGRELARLDWGRAAPADTLAFLTGDPKRDRDRVVSEADIELHEVAPHLFTIDLAALNMRVMVAEFADHVAVLEGAYSSQNCDRIARKVRERLGKPARWFAFSHLHGQYVGGTRSWVHAGATVLVPPTTAPLIEAMVKTPHDLCPDALGRDPQPLRLERVPEKKCLEDATNALEIYNVESGHTDEYFIFYFPRQKVLFNGDLLFYRPGKPLSARSQQLCSTVQKLGLDVATYYCTWPLDGYGTHNVVTAEEMRNACGPAN